MITTVLTTPAVEAVNTIVVCLTPAQATDIANAMERAYALAEGFYWADYPTFADLHNDLTDALDEIAGR